MFFYSLGPALSMALAVVSLTVWSLLSSQIASESEEEDVPDEDSGHAAMVNSPLRADPAQLRSPGVSSVSTAHPLMRQGA
jgi:hypothetical protein